MFNGISALSMGNIRYKIAQNEEIINISIRYQAI